MIVADLTKKHACRKPLARVRRPTLAIAARLLQARGGLHARQAIPPGRDQQRQYGEKESGYVRIEIFCDLGNRREPPFVGIRSVERHYCVLDHDDSETKACIVAAM
jgi:hypothetical protein